MNLRNGKLVATFIGALAVAGVGGIVNMSLQLRGLTTTIDQADLKEMTKELTGLRSQMESWSGIFGDVQQRLTAIEQSHVGGLHPAADRRLMLLEDMHGPSSHHIDRR